MMLKATPPRPWILRNVILTNIVTDFEREKSAPANSSVWHREAPPLLFHVRVWPPWATEGLVLRVCVCACHSEEEWYVIMAPNMAEMKPTSDY
jgi:hypothetical protein